MNYTSLLFVVGGLAVGLLLGLALGAWRWRRAVLKLNQKVSDRDAELMALKQSAPAENDAATNQKSFEFGLKLYRVNKFEQAFPVLLQHAEAGHAHATSLVAKMYFAGNGVARDKERYRYWLNRAADSGDKAAKAISKRL